MTQLEEQTLGDCNLSLWLRGFISSMGSGELAYKASVSLKCINLNEVSLKHWDYKPGKKKKKKQTTNIMEK